MAEPHRLSVFREGTMRANTFRGPAYERPPENLQQASFDYKPKILRTLSLSSIFVLAIALIALLEYAVIELAHGTSSHGDQQPGTVERRSLNYIYPRNDTSSVSAAATTSSASSSASLMISGTSSSTTATDIESVYALSAAQSNYVQTDATQTVTTSASKVATELYVDPSNYVSTDASQTVTLTTSSEVPTVAPSADQSEYVPTDTTQTITSPSLTTAMIMSTSDYVPTDTTQTISQTPNTSPTTAKPYTTTQSGATVINVPVGDSKSSVISSTATIAVTLTTDGQTVYSSMTTASAISTVSPSYSPSTSYTAIVTTVTPQSRIVRTSSSTLTSVLGGSTSIYTSDGKVRTTVSGGSTLTSVVVSTSSSSPGNSPSGLPDTQNGKPVTIAHHWSVEQTFLGTYLAVLVAVCYKMLWTVLYNNFTLIEPFRQLNEANGASAEKAFFSFYQSQSNLLGPLPPLFKRRWALGLAATCYLVACIFPALSSEAIYVDTNWDCPYPIEGSRNPCQARMTANITVLRILQGLLGFTALATLVLIAVLLYTKTGLPANPSSIATVASLMRNPGLLEDLNEIPSDADSKQMQVAMTSRRYKLDYHKSASTEVGYGIIPMHGGQDGLSGTHRYTAVSGAELTSKGSHPAHRFRFMDFVLAFVVLGAFGVVLAYYLDGNSDGFNNYFSSNTFGPRFILTGAATVVASLWKSVEQSAVVMAPYGRLARRPSPPSHTLLFTPHNTPFLATVSTVLSGYFSVAAITGVTLLAEALNIVISGVPYATGQTWMQFLVSIYMSIGILSIMLIVAAMVIISRRREPKIPRKPDVLGAVMSYLSGSRSLDDFEGAEWQDADTRDRRIRLLGKKYVFREMTRRDGKFAWSVDESHDGH